MAITLTSVPIAKKSPPGKTLFHLCGYSADASGAEALKVGPTSGYIVIERMTVAVLAAITLDVGSDAADDPSAVGTSVWNLAGTAEGAVYSFEFKRPVPLTATHAFVMDASGAGAVVVEAEGFVVGS